MVVIIFGLPYTGKSYFATRLSKEIGAIYISSQQARDRLFVSPTNIDTEKEKAYTYMQKCMKENVKLKENIVLDASFDKVMIRKTFLKETVSLTAETYFVEIRASEEVVYERMRKAGVREWQDVQRYEKVKHDFQHHTYPHLILNSSHNNIKEMLGEALNYLPSYSENVNIR